MVLEGNNQEFPLWGWITMRFTINTRSAYHAFGVLKNLPIDMPSGGKFPLQHECQIMYKASLRDALGNNDGYCNACVRNKEKIKAEHDPKLPPTPKSTPAKCRDLSCVVVPTRLPDEQERRRE